MACSRPPAPSTRIFTGSSLLAVQYSGGMRESDHSRDDHPFGHQYGRSPSSSPLIPGWLQVTYMWVIVSFTCTLIVWYGFRMAGFGRGDVPQATISLTVGLIAGTIVTVLLRRRRSGRGRNSGGGAR